jgi:hypothetical protein
VVVVAVAAVVDIDMKITEKQNVGMEFTVGYCCAT